MDEAPVPRQPSGSHFNKEKVDDPSHSEKGNGFAPGGTSLAAHAPLKNRDLGFICGSVGSYRNPQE